MQIEVIIVKKSHKLDAEEGKTTFVTLLGLDGARREAARLTAEAEQILQQFPHHAFLTALTQELLTREK